MHTEHPSSIVEMRQDTLEISSFLIRMEGARDSCTKQDGGTTLKFPCTKQYGEKAFLLTTSWKELPWMAAEPEYESLRGKNDDPRLGEGVAPLDEKDTIGDEGLANMSFKGTKGPRAEAIAR